MSTKKLYVLTITHKAYVYAESEYDAKERKSDVIDWENPDVDATPVTGNPLGWDGECLVYHSGHGDVYLRDVLPGGSHHA